MNKTDSYHAYDSDFDPENDTNDPSYSDYDFIESNKSNSDDEEPSGNNYEGVLTS